MATIIKGIEYDFLQSSQSEAVPIIFNHDTEKPSDARTVVADLEALRSLPKTYIGMVVTVLNSSGLTQDSNSNAIASTSFDVSELVIKQYMKVLPNGQGGSIASGETSNINDWLDLSVNTSTTTIKDTVDMRLESYQVGDNPDLLDATLRSNASVGDLYLVENCYNPTAIALANTKLALIISMDSANGADASALVEQDLIDIGVVVDDWATNSAAIKAAIAANDTVTDAGSSVHEVLVAEIQATVNGTADAGGTAVPKANKTIDSIDGRTAPTVNTAFLAWNGSAFVLITPAYQTEPTTPLYADSDSGQFTTDVQSIARGHMTDEYDGVSRFKAGQIIYNSYNRVKSAAVSTILENELYLVQGTDTIEYNSVTYNPSDTFSGVTGQTTFIKNGGEDCTVDLIVAVTDVYRKLTDNDTGGIHTLDSTTDFLKIGTTDTGNGNIDDTIGNTASSTPSYPEKTLSAEEIDARISAAVSAQSLNTGISGGAAATNFDSNGVPI